MRVTVIPSASRGHANHGWLNSKHTFSFAQYYNPEMMNFGVLRVFNDDTVQAGEGFGTHPHNDMEIISIPLKGVLAHKDSMGHTETLVPGDIQVMSAGTGLTHSEYNGSTTENVEFLQLWIIPKERGLEPRYDQTKAPTNNGLHTVVGPKNAEAPLWINQEAFLSVVKLSRGESTTYQRKRESNGVFVFVIEGAAKVAGETASRRDSVAITDADSININADEDLYAVVLDVPDV